MKKRLLSVLLIIAMVATMLPALTLTASAESVSIDLSAPGSGGTGYTVSGTSTARIITITGAGNTYTLSKSMKGHVIVPVDCTLILDGATIEASSSYKEASKYPGASKNITVGAISIEKNANVTITLKANTTSTLTGSSSAAIAVENVVRSNGTAYLASVTINGAGTLRATGGGQSAAIGGNVNHPTGNIKIEDGTIRATGGDWAPAIGDGDSDTAYVEYNVWRCQGETKNSSYPVTCSPAKIEITGGTITAVAGKATPGIGTSDELGHKKHSGYGVDGDRVWPGLSIEISGGEILTVGGTTTNTSNSALGAGKHTKMPKENVVVNAGVSMVALTYASSHPLNSSGLENGVDNLAPSISNESTANVLSIRYTTAVSVSDIDIQRLVSEPSNFEPVASIQKLLSESGITAKISGLAVALPDGTYKVNVGGGSIVILEGGGLVYTDSDEPVYTARVITYLNDVETDIGKTFRLEKSGTYYVPGAVQAGTYNLVELLADGTYGPTIEQVKLPGSDANNMATVHLYYFDYTYDDGSGNPQTVYEQGEKGTPPSTVTEPEAPEKDGYIFDGWEDDTDGDNDYVAKWSPITYTVVFNANGGTGTTGTNNRQSFTYDQAQNLTANGFYRTGYTFKGWATSAAGVYSGGTATWAYSDRQSVKNLTTANDGQVDLYAVWEANAVISGAVSIDNKYNDPADNNTEKVANEGDRADSTVLILLRKTASDSDYGQVKAQEVVFDTSKVTDSATYDFSGYPATDANGNAYTYIITTQRQNYDVSYDGYDIALKYNPVCYDIEFEIDASGVQGVLPEEVHVKVLYRYEVDDKTVTGAPDADGIITQHKDIYVNATYDSGKKAYVGSYPVWIYSTKVETEDDTNVVKYEHYDYHIQVVSYVHKGETATVAAANSAFTVSDYGDWVSFVPDDSSIEGTTVGAPSGVMTAKLNASASYSITYEYNGGTADGGASTSYTYGSETELAETGKAHYTFDGWFDKDQDEEGATEVESISANDYGDKSLYAWWTPVEYSITYDTTDCTLTDTDYDSSYNVEDTLTGDDASLVLAVPAKPGYSFDGWYTDSGLDDAFTPGTGGNVTLYPKWTAHTYQVEFVANVNGASGSMSNQSFTYGEAAKALTGNGYTANGYTFLGWATSPDGAAAMYSDGQSVQNLTTVDNGTKYLYGVWEIDVEAKIYYSYDDNGSVEDIPSSTTRADGITVSLLRRLASETGANFVPVLDEDNNPVTLDLSFDDETTTKEGNAYLFDIDDGSFTGYPTADANGNIYEYSVATSLSNYDVYYGAITSGGNNSAGCVGSSNPFYITLVYNPNSFDIEFVISPDDIADGYEPESVLIKIHYVNFGDEKTPDDEISQHESRYLTVAAGNDGNYSGQEAVWKYDLAGDPYGYRIEIIGYVLLDEDDEPYTVMADDSGYEFTWGSDAADGEEWVYYDGDDTPTMTASVSAKTFDIAYEPNGGTMPDDAADSFTYGVGLETLPTPTRPGYVFDGWYILDDLDNEVGIDTIAPGTVGDLTLNAKWKTAGGSVLPPIPNPDPKPPINVDTGDDKQDGGSVSTDLSDYKPGDDVVISTKPDEGNKVIDIVVTDKDGNPVEFVNNGDGTFTVLEPDKDVVVQIVFGDESEVVSPNVTGVNKLLVTDDHISYLNGYPDGTVRPEGNMTRAEAAQMFYNLLIDKNVVTEADFADVTAKDWYVKAVLVLAEMDIISGYNDGTFRPNDHITRAEFAAMAMRFAYATGGTAKFEDVTDGYWAYDYIMAAAGYGWINGYNDSTFRPGNSITRAEVATIMNYMLYREADRSFVNRNPGSLREFSDLADAGVWYYYNMVEATNAHDYERGEGMAETWTGLR